MFGSVPAPGSKPALGYDTPASPILRPTCLQMDYECRHKNRTMPLQCDFQKQPSWAKRELHVNTYLYMSYVYAKDMNVSGCWVCTHIPTHAKGEIPLRPVPLNLSETVEWHIYQNGTRQCPRTIRIASLVRNPEGGAASSLSFLPISPRPWKEGGYPVNTFEMWYQPSYDQSHQPPFLTLTNTTNTGRPLGIICLVRNVVKGIFKGASRCKHKFVVANISKVYPVNTSPQFYGCTLDVPYANGTGTFKYSLMAEGFDVDKLTSYNGTYFICGHKAYPWLPENWTGSCYLGYVVPFIHHLANLGDHYQMMKREKRAITETQRYFGILLPPIGVALALKEIRKVAKILEEVANDTTEALTEINNEMVAIRTVALQNRIVLDYLFANKGGTCAVIGSECCNYIPDRSENITHLVDHIRTEVKKLHETSRDGWLDWLFDGSWGSYLVHGLIILVVVILGIIMLSFLMKCLCKSVGAAVISQQLVQQHEVSLEELMDVKEGAEIRRKMIEVQIEWERMRQVAMD
ncbi:syncytin-2-like [Scyliorhinus torazame]|uniref:syncytin-2-like n=1 Tax=Scyliorhinus torazame TaxID=75743 RepID=UPI003B596F3D